MPKKTFTAGEVLAAADVNTFLMDQSVMTFADSAARGSAIGTATEGMVTYLEDTDGLELWNGTAWTGVGGGAATNAIINGAFEINQRGFTSTTSAGVFTFDRWATNQVNGTVTHSAQAFTPGAAPVAGYESANFLRCITTGQSAANSRANITTTMEDVRTFAGQTITVSFFAKADTGTPEIGIQVQQNFGGGGSSATDTSSKVTISTSWQRYSLTFAVPSISGKTIGTNSFLRINFWFSAGTDFSVLSGGIGIQSNTFDVWGVQVEAGSTATPFRRNANSLQGELAACQRYYFRQGAGNGDALFANFAFGNAKSTTVAVFRVQFPQSLRAAPASVEFGSPLQLDFGGSGIAVTTLTLGTFSQTLNAATLEATVASGLTQHRPYYLTSQNSTAAFVAFSAEL